MAPAGINRLTPGESRGEKDRETLMTCQVEQRRKGKLDMMGQGPVMVLGSV